MAFTAPTPSDRFETANPFARSAQAQLDAMGKLARIGADTMRQVMKQQQDLFLTVMGRWRDSAGNTPNEPAALMELPLDMARFGTEIALQNAAELAGIARQAQADMLAVLSRRAEEITADAAHAVEEGVKETGKLAKRAVAKTAAATDSAFAGAAQAPDATLDQIADAGKMVE